MSASTSLNGVRLTHLSLSVSAQPYNLCATLLIKKSSISELQLRSTVQKSGTYSVLLELCHALRYRHVHALFRLQGKTQEQIIIEKKNKPNKQTNKQTNKHMEFKPHTTTCTGI